MPTDSLGDSVGDMCFPDRTMASKLLTRTQGCLCLPTVNLVLAITRFFIWSVEVGKILHYLEHSVEIS